MEPMEKEQTIVGKAKVCLLMFANYVVAVDIGHVNAR